MGKLLIFLFCVSVSAYAYEIMAYFSPEGGFSPLNNKREISVGNEIRKATLNAAALRFFSKARRGSEIRIGMYSFSSPEILKALIAASKNGAHIKIIMDACESMSGKTIENLRKSFLNHSGIELAGVTPEALLKGGRITSFNPNSTGSKPSMHEKFGVHWYRIGGKTYFDSFTGSSNFSDGSNSRYAENRILTEDDPVTGKRTWEEFESLWSNFRGACYSDNCTAEKEPEGLSAIPDYGPEEVYLLQKSYGACAGECSFDSDFKDCMKYCKLPPEVQSLASFPGLTIFNSQVVGLKRNGRPEFASIERGLLNVLNFVNPGRGIIRIGTFKFGNRVLAEGISRFAKNNPDVEIRVLLNQTEIFGSKGDVLERASSNVKVRYKWRANAYGWDGESASIGVMHSGDFKYHHKMILVDDTCLANGSFNFTNKAEKLNFENESFYENFSGDKPEVQKVINQFMWEFDSLWFDDYHEGSGVNVMDGITLSAKEAKRSARRILSYFDERIYYAIKDMASDEKKEFISRYKSTPPYELLPRLFVRDTIMKKAYSNLSQIVKKTGLSRSQVINIVKEMKELKLIVEKRRKYFLAD